MLVILHHYNFLEKFPHTSSTYICIKIDTKNMEIKTVLKNISKKFYQNFTVRNMIKVEEKMFQTVGKKIWHITYN